MANEDHTAASATSAPVGSAAPSPRVDRASGPVGGSGGAGSGRTTIEDSVVAKVAGIAAREVRGVYALGGGASRAFGAIRSAVNSTDLTQGVHVEVGETQAAADITIVVEYPTPVQQVANEVRAAVTNAISGLVGLEVVEVNVEVNDVHLPNEDNDDEESRVS